MDSFCQSGPYAALQSIQPNVGCWIWVEVRSNRQELVRLETVVDDLVHILLILKRKNKPFLLLFLFPLHCLTYCVISSCPLFFLSFRFSSIQLSQVIHTLFIVRIFSLINFPINFILHIYRRLKRYMLRRF